MTNNSNSDLFNNFLNDLSTAALQAAGKMSIIDFANRIIFNNDPDFQLYPTQKAILKSFYNEPLTEQEIKILNAWVDEERSTWVQDRKYISLILEAGRRASKALDVNTLIKTTKGFKKLKHVHIGDYVFNEHGHPTKVINETNITNKPCYSILFSNGIKVNCSQDHLWRTIQLDGTISSLTADEIFKSEYIGNKPNHCVDLYIPLLEDDKRFIIGMEKITPLPVKCLEVEDSSHVYLITKALIPTHNCNSESSKIITTEGDITYGELHKRLSNNEKIGIYTYNIQDTITKSYVTYDIKTELNQIEQTYKITTQTGKTEIVNNNHPFLTCNRNSHYPIWKELKYLQPGNYIATSSEVPIFGKHNKSKEELIILALSIAIFRQDEKLAAYNKYKDLLFKVYKTNDRKKLDECLNKQKFKYNSKDITSLTKESTIILFDILLHILKIRKVRQDRVSSEGNRFNGRCEVSIETHLFVDELASQLLKLGISSYRINEPSDNKQGLSICNSNSIERLVDIFGFNIYKGKDYFNKFFPYRNLTEGGQTIGKDIFSRSEDLLENQYPPTAIKSHNSPTYKAYNTLVKGRKNILADIALKINDSKLYDWCTNNINWEKIKSIEPYKIEQTIALEVKDTHVIGNAIISHNSTMASIIALKEFYDLLIEDSPQKKYGIAAASPIAILVMAQSQAQVKETIFAAMRGYAENSNFFTALKNKGDIEILSEEIRCRKKNISIFAKHTNSKSLVGYTLKAMVLDEVARFETIGEDGKNKAFEIWDNVASGGATFGGDFKKVAISSAWEPGDPIEQMFNTALKNPNSLAFKLTTFQINLNITKESPNIQSEYINDFIKARREFEGIRFTKFNTFIEIENLNRAARSISVIDSIPCQIDTQTAGGPKHYAGLTIQRIAPNQISDSLSFIHVDPALKKDSAALAIARPVQEEGKWKIQIDALLKWEPHTDHQGNKRVVSFIDIEEKLIAISNIRKTSKITFDIWNSESLIQKLNSLGIDAQQVSCSREMQFTYYTLFRDLLAHDYIILPRDSVWTNNAITELSELVLKSNKQIIHPTAGKDLADAIVNAVYQCNQYMIKSGLNLSTGLHTNVIQSQGLRKITVSKVNTNNLKIGKAIDKLYKNKF